MRFTSEFLSNFNGFTIETTMLDRGVYLWIIHLRHKKWYKSDFRGRYTAKATHNKEGYGMTITPPAHFVKDVKILEEYFGSK